MSKGLLNQEDLDKMIEVFSKDRIDEKTNEVKMTYSTKIYRDPWSKNNFSV
jgi:hypothetical protein